MRVGLLTVHHSFNYGAMLQAYATFNILRKLGHEVEFIDYDREAAAKQRKAFMPNDSIGNILKNFRNLFQYCSIVQRIEKFEKFYQKFRVSSSRYERPTEWDTSMYDVVVTGSDQTFSLYLTDKPQDMRPFFQGHINGVKKISYASSMGEKFAQLTPEDISWMKERFRAFDSLSVREAPSADFIEKLIGKRPQVVLDPTLMLSREEWEEECVPVEDVTGEYIAFYTVLSDTWVVNAVKQLSAETGLKVIALHPRTRYEIFTGFRYKIGICPGEFISLIKNARYVVTTSFHATCFSLLFQKKFVSLLVGEGNRLRALLSATGLQTQLVGSDSTDIITRLENEVNYAKAATLLQKEIDASQAYLNDALKP